MIQPTSALGSKPSLTYPETAEPKGSSISKAKNRSDNDLLRLLSPVVTAILVDAGFYLKRMKHIFGNFLPHEAAQKLHEMALYHLNHENGRRPSRLYRIFVYDAPPAEWKGHTPLEKKSIDYTKSDVAIWRSEFHKALRGLRKVALRLGEVPTNSVQWQINHLALKELIKGKKQWADIKDTDFKLDFRQKGVDMRLGLDISSLAFKGQVNQIILVSGDADFVPAAKLARREGIDFILDPMWATIRSDLYENIDGLRSVFPKPAKVGVSAANPNGKAASVTQTRRVDKPQSGAIHRFPSTQSATDFV